MNFLFLISVIYFSLSIISYIILSSKLKKLFLFDFALKKTVISFELLLEDSTLYKEIEILKIEMPLVPPVVDILFCFGLITWIRINKEHNKIMYRYRDRPDFKLYIRNKNFKNLIKKW